MSDHLRVEAGARERVEVVPLECVAAILAQPTGLDQEVEDGLVAVTGAHPDDLAAL